MRLENVATFLYNSHQIGKDYGFRTGREDSTARCTETECDGDRAPRGLRQRNDQSRGVWLGIQFQTRSSEEIGKEERLRGKTMQRGSVYRDRTGTWYVSFRDEAGKRKHQRLSKY